MCQQPKGWFTELWEKPESQIHLITFNYLTIQLLLAHYETDFFKTKQKVLYLRISIRCSNGSGLFVRDTSLVRHVAASNWEQDDWKKNGKNTEH